MPNPYAHNVETNRRSFARAAIAMMALAQARPNGKYAGIAPVLAAIRAGHHTQLVRIAGTAPTRASLRRWILALETYGVGCLRDRCPVCRSRGW